MNFTHTRPGLKARAAHVALAMTGAATVLTLGVAAVTALPANAAGLASDVAAALKLRLPKTPVDALTCDTLGPWCEVVSGDTLFYIDETARYLFVGRLYDMEERRDVTAARLLEFEKALDKAQSDVEKSVSQTRPQPSEPKGAAAKPRVGQVKSVLRRQ